MQNRTLQVAWVLSSGKRYIIRFHLKHLHNKMIYAQEVPKYIEKSLYTEMKLPFKMGP
jgi:hypothetical protein